MCTWPCVGSPTEAGIVALPDTDGDGRADLVRRFGAEGGTAMEVSGTWLYFAPDSSVMRYPLKDGELVPTGKPEILVEGFPRGRQHAGKPFALDRAGSLCVNVGAPSNACQERDRSPGSPSLDPCPLLNRSGGIWRFRADRPGQLQQGVSDRYATGIRNAVAIA
jgi:glucose/arabinose dehydrogenase